MSTEAIYKIAGKTIERIIVKKNKDSQDSPAMQVFLLFTDKTYYELYSNKTICFTGGVDAGDRETVLRYLSDAMDVSFECFLDEHGQPTCVSRQEK